MTKRKRTLDIEVLWGSIVDAPGDVHVVGHYQGVLPQYAEAALDAAVSAVKEEPVIRDLTVRGVIRGALGDVYFIPWDGTRSVVIAGMGLPGSFRRRELRKLMMSLATTVARVRPRAEITSVLIGAGAGNLPLPDCIDAMLTGLAEAFEDHERLDTRRFRIVELYLDRALAILQALTMQVGDPRFKGVTFRLNPRLQKGRGRTIPETFSYSMLLAAVARETLTPTSTVQPLLDKVLTQLLPRGPDVRKVFAERFRDKDGKAKPIPKSLHRLAMEFPVARVDVPAADRLEIPTRLVFSFDGRHVRGAAITDTATVSQREVSVPQDLFRDTLDKVTRIAGLPVDEVMSLGRDAFALLIPRDLESVLDDADPKVIEVDRTMADVPWERLVAGDRPLGLKAPLARQLRTTYSPPPLAAADRDLKTALVIGDPGTGDFSLAGARKEAASVARILISAGIETTLLIGVEDDITEDGHVRGSKPATLLNTLRALHAGVDLVHYCGHAVYERDRPDLAGWVFGDGRVVLTAESLRQMKMAPLLVVANACVSAPVSQRRTGRRLRGGAIADARLIAGLADEFFRNGVRDFIGTSMPIAEAPAVAFARGFYTRLIKGKVSQRSIGDALFETREELARRRSFGLAWAAYQHYGDPTRRLIR